MKHLKKISVLAAVLVMVSMILASCGGGGLKGDPAVGTWGVTEVEYAGQTLSADDLKSTGQMDEMPKLEDQGRRNLHIRLHGCKVWEGTCFRWRRRPV